MRISLGFSTCPNDTFMFDALVNGRIDTGDIEYDVTLADIFHLNQMAQAGKLDMVKVSYNTFGHLLDSYTLLDAGSALGHNCGPLLIARHPISPEQLQQGNLTVAIPGLNTTANLLLDYFAPQVQRKEEMIFHEVMPAVVAGKADAGVIIHENRFTYQDLGLVCIQDLGEYWEAHTQLPIPLGAIVARTGLGTERIQQIESQLRASVAYAFNHPEASHGFVKQHAQEMEAAVMQSHIQLYVNEYSLSLRTKGRAAIHQLLQTGEQAGNYPKGTSQRFQENYQVMI